MLWEGKPLREIREQDIRAVIDSGLEEHLQLEYKSALYEDSDRGRREWLLDVAMFANTIGGIILIGVAERRDAQGQPTGVPDPDVPLGLEVQNPEAVLSAYDARVTAAIEERLPLESASVEVANGRRVLVIRVPNSTAKPHSVRQEGHIYFPARRERQRYHMSVREIKELVMRTASRMQQAEESLRKVFSGVLLAADAPLLTIGIIPVFAADFLVQLDSPRIREVIGNFTRTGPPQYRDPIYTFGGLERRNATYEHRVLLARNGALRTSSQVPAPSRPEGTYYAFGVSAIDILLRSFVLKARSVYEQAAIDAPYLLWMNLNLPQQFAGIYPGIGGFGEEYTEPVAAKNYEFPFVEIDNLGDVDRIIRPLCDQAHQMFGRERSPNFGAAGEWNSRILT